MLFRKLLLTLSLLAVQAAALTIGGRPNQLIYSDKRDLLQNLVSFAILLKIT